MKEYVSEKCWKLLTPNIKQTFNIHILSQSRQTKLDLLRRSITILYGNTFYVHC